MQDPNPLPVAANTAFPTPESGGSTGNSQETGWAVWGGGEVRITQLNRFALATSQMVQFRFGVEARGRISSQEGRLSSQAFTAELFRFLTLR